MRLLLIVLLLLFSSGVHSQNAAANKFRNRILEDRFIQINGIEQWITIRGDSTRPVILFIHGGPGSPMSPYADRVYGSWEKDFVLVQWDQRGTGRTYGRNAPAELSPEYLRSNPLSVEQMTADGIAVAEHLVKRFAKQRIILFGTSWGSVLAVKMAQQRPDLFYAYIGHSQIVNPVAGAVDAYENLYRLAQVANDYEALDVLKAIGKPPYDTARNSGKLIRITKQYQQKNSMPAPASWFELPPHYNNEKDEEDRNNGDDYSFVNYAGDKRLGVTSMSFSIDFIKDGLLFKIPVYLIQGEDDIQTPVKITKEYFEKLKAPHKQFFLLPRTDHGFNQSVVDMHYKIMKMFIMPLIDKDR